jgi:hypothetical protein
MDMLGEIEPDDLAVALGRHTALIDHLKASGEWDSLGCALCGLSVSLDFGVGRMHGGLQGPLGLRMPRTSFRGVRLLRHLSPRGLLPLDLCKAACPRSS